MMRNRFMVCIAAMLLMAFGSLSYAQDNGPAPGHGGPERGWGMRRNPEFMYTFRLMRMTGGISALIQRKDHTLTPSQAKQILAVLRPLRNKARLKPEEAKVASAKLEKVYTKAQIEILDQMRPNRRGQRPNMNGGNRWQGVRNANQNNREARPPRQGGPGRRFDPNAMKDWNPFYAKAAPTGNGRFSQEMAKRTNAMFDDLKKRASGK